MTILGPKELESVIPLSTEPYPYAARLIVVGLLRGWDQDTIQRIADHYDMELPTRDAAIAWAIKRRWETQ